MTVDLRAYLVELEAWNSTRADARTPWRITERGAPSPRAYIRLVRGWWSRFSDWLFSIPDMEPLEALQALATGGPKAPTPADVAKANEPAASKAIRGARSELVRAGMPQQVLARRLGVVQGPGGVGVDLTGIDIVKGGVEQAALDAWAAEGVAYIRAVPAERLGSLAAKVREAVTGGRRWETLRDDVRAELGIGERHLELIARDQVAKLNGRITQSLQEAAGVSSYRWRAARDGRTRATHRAVDGQVFTWASGGPSGVGFYNTRAHPGQAGQCRCSAEPVIEVDW